MHIGQEVLALLERPPHQVRYLRFQQIDRPWHASAIYGIHDQQHIVAIEQILNKADAPNAYLYHGDGGRKVTLPCQALHHGNAEAIVTAKDIADASNQYMRSIAWFCTLSRNDH
jgi:hypothetical protein